jgi:hypothetical protein
MIYKFNYNFEIKLTYVSSSSLMVKTLQHLYQNSKEDNKIISIIFYEV